MSSGQLDMEDAICKMLDNEKSPTEIIEWCFFYLKRAIGKRTVKAALKEARK